MNEMNNVPINNPMPVDDTTTNMNTNTTNNNVSDLDIANTTTYEETNVPSEVAPPSVDIIVDNNTNTSVNVHKFNNNLIKDIAVKEEISDIRKRDLIYKKTGFNVNNAINVNHIMEDDSQSELEEAPKRKAAPINTAAETVGDKVVRKAGTLPKYNVVVTTK